MAELCLGEPDYLGARAFAQVGNGCGSLNSWYVGDFVARQGIERVRILWKRSSLVRYQTRTILDGVW
jgi:membrane protein YqaA with SNARE-associated domain